MAIDGASFARRRIEGNMMSNRIFKGSLLATTVIAGMSLAIPAYAQDATNAPQEPTSAPSPTTPGETVASQAPADTTGPASEEIVVTGTLIKAVTTPSPVTTLTVSNLDQRGISTVQEGIQRIASNNGPALTNSFTANGAFAAGASAVSLRGLSTNSTLVLFDGMRAAYYPLADDGTRNFVDLNTIPDDIVERVEILRDGASSTYGADAIAGVVNIITKKNIQGVSARAEAGISSRGDAQQYRGSVTAGFGDLDDKGINAYVSGMFYKSEMLYNRDRPYPYNTDDYTQLCNDGTCGFNGVLNGLDADGVYNTGFAQTTPFAVRPRVAATGGAVAGRTRYTYLNGCMGLPEYTPTAAELADAAHNSAAPATGPVCQEDLTNLYGVISPEIKRFGISGRVTARIGNDLEAYVAANFLQSSSFDTYIPATIRANAPAPFYNIRYSTSANVLAYGNNTVLQLPVYICPRTTPGACTAANGTLNPNNPYAAEGFTAAILGRIPNLFEENFSRTRAYRAAAGLKGTVSGWDFNVNATGMHIDLLRKYNGYVYIQNLLDLIKDGSYNFRDPLANSQATLDYLAPEARATSTSDLVQFDANATRPVAELAGGPLTIAVGASVRYEAVDSPSINSDIHGGTQRYFRLNAFALKGDRTVYSTYGEINAPVLESLTLNASGRFDKYPGTSNFSPKAGVVFKPLGRTLTLRGTVSRGFRIPSFGEANATYPTTGFVTANRGIYENFFLNQYGCDNSVAGYANCPAYVTTTSYGQTSLSNPDLKPEKSKSLTLGAVVEPLRGVQLSVDFYTIKKTDVITTASNSPAIEAYYSGQPIPAGYTVVPDAPDPNNPTALPRIAFVQSGFINANTQKVSGFDFGLNVNRNLTDNIRMTTVAEASYIRRLSMKFPDGHTERYDGTLGNFNLTAGSGTPKWKGTWTTALEFNRTFTIAGTMNYFGGYDLSAMDQGTGYKDCGLSDGSIPCHVDNYKTFDLNAQWKVNNRFTFIANMQNIFDKMPPIDTVTYGAHAYNPVQGGEGIYGRYFKAGVKANF
jgi:iron complex outermembrane recepter protein